MSELISCMNHFCDLLQIFIQFYPLKKIQDVRKVLMYFQIFFYEANSQNIITRLVLF